VSGLRLNADDLQLLRLVEKDQRSLPAFSLSRLIAMQLVERHPEGLRITEKGQALLAKE
jgi:hypothetical protein